MSADGIGGIPGKYMTEGGCDVVDTTSDEVEDDGFGGRVCIEVERDMGKVVECDGGDGGGDVTDVGGDGAGVERGRGRL
ncbi:hypothetical protein L1987_43127 [Smallanthus sonchifolius]|uniref:Uncharacterized protein n=1 Tax=Smallanthus sonchifolius TaxID=185202 RepID=A0ACB9GLS5_9ASTR|nr:hypothetical protein L1987_43127 [Smallanthus sonchifolius]